MTLAVRHKLFWPFRNIWLVVNENRNYQCYLKKWWNWSWKIAWQLKCQHRSMKTMRYSLWYSLPGLFLPEASFGLRVLSLPASVCPCVYQSLACPHDNSSSRQARITKFSVQVQKTLVKVPIVLGGDGPWPSRSNLTWKSYFTSFWACPHDNLSSVQARVTKFGPKMHLSMVNVPIDLGVDRLWSSVSNLT